jgi:phage shock protein C
MVEGTRWPDDAAMTDIPQASPRRLTRSTDDRWIGGVCGGLAAHLGVDPVIVRLVVALAALAGGTGVLAYLVAWVLIPKARP